MIFSWLQSIPWHLDADDLPQWTDLPRPHSDAFVWSSLLADIARHPRAPEDPWIANLRRDVA